jgi:hypothetical protein
MAARYVTEKKLLQTLYWNFWPSFFRRDEISPMLLPEYREQVTGKSR